MSKLKKILAGVMVATVVLTSAVGCGTADEEGTEDSVQNEIQVSDAIVAVIERRDIPESLFNIYFWNAQQDFEQLLGPTAWEMDLDGMNLEDLAKEGALNSIVLSVVADNKARLMGISLAEEERELAKEGAQNFAEANPDILINHGFSEADVEQFLLSTVMISRLEQQLMDNYMPSEEDIQQHVNENIHELGTVTAKHILIKTTDDANQPLPEEVLQSKKILANELLVRALSGEDMATLATQYSEDTGSIATGGEYTFGRGEMVPEFEHAAYEGQAGVVWPELVETVFGYHIIKTESHNVASEEEIRQSYIESEKMAFIQNEFPDMIESAKVEKTDVYDSIQMYKPIQE